jgi:hypothetical protein
MIIAVDFDDTIVEQGEYADTTTPLRFKPGAREGLYSLKEAGHVLILWSGRASRALLYNPELDPLVRAGVRKLNHGRWLERRPVHLARYRQMLAFVAAELPDVFAAIDDGAGGKPSADLFIDDKALRLGRGFGIGGTDWNEIARAYGAPLEASQ